MPLTFGVLFGVVIVPAVVFALMYSAIVTQLPRGLVSPYPKADVRVRLLAAAADGLLIVTFAFLFWRTESFVWILVSALYSLCRDGVAGQSIGKFFFGLVVIDLKTGRPATFGQSFRRNVPLALPGANVAAVFLEARALIRDSQGQRLGDRLAQTQVVEGLGAKDLVKSFQNWLTRLGDAVGQAGGRRRPADRHRRWAARSRHCAAGHPRGSLPGRN
jgi:uncharacterized RDD family membrane protein YckC